MDVQVNALSECVELVNMAESLEVIVAMKVGVMTCVNIASAMCQLRDGLEDEATMLIYSTARDLEGAIRSARQAMEAVRTGNPLIAMLGLDDSNNALNEVAQCADGMVALHVALTAWLNATAPEHKTRTDPALHTYTETCLTHHDATGDGTCCCCRQSHEAHWHYQTLAEAQAGYDEIPEDERADFDTYLEQLVSNDLINPAALESA